MATLPILVVEDNPADVYFISEALRQACTECEITVISDGADAWNYLQRKCLEEPRPELVILDLNLPGRDGAELLELIRSSPNLSRTFVAIVSSSPADQMRRRAERADCYVTKPSDMDEFLGIGHQIFRSMRAGA